MVRPSMLPHPRSILLLAVLAIALPVPPARSQDRAVQDRLDRLERDLSMLQRQVYRGGAPQVVSTGPGAAVDTELRMDRLEEQMRELTGRVEDATNAVEQLRRRVEQINSDVDVRLSQDQVQQRGTVPGFRAPAAVPDSSPAPIAMRMPPMGNSAAGYSAGANSARSTQQGQLMPPGTLVPPPPDLPPGGDSLAPPSSQVRQQFANAGPAGTLRAPSASSLPSGSTSEQYSAAYGLLKQADYPAAEEAFKEFIAQHPNDPLSGSAQYWLGETYYVRGRYAEAATAFAEGYKNYPKGTKASDDLLKLAMSLARANQKQNACVAFAELDRDFPHAGSAIKERASAEKKRLGC
jgi:tol-pal system protein YbgF